MPMSSGFKIRCRHFSMKFLYRIVSFLCCVVITIGYVIFTYTLGLKFTPDPIIESEIDVRNSNMFDEVRKKTIGYNLQSSKFDINTTYIVYDCSKLNKGLWGSCGGWSDRISGMLNTYIISVLTGKRFLIHHDNPCQLSNYLMPKKYDWRFDENIVKGRSSSFSNFYCEMPSSITNHTLSSLRSAFTKHVNFVRSNWDYSRHFREIKNIWKLAPWLTQLHTADIYTEFFNAVFKPKDVLTNVIDRILNTTRKKIACAHIRIGGSATIPMDFHRLDKNRMDDIWKFLLDMKKRNYDIFVATDADVVRSKAEELFKESLIVIPGPITHIDRTIIGNTCDGFRKSLLDFFLLTKCHELIITESGFGMTAAFLNRVHDHLYCFKNGLFPCSRYTVHDFFPGEMFSPR